VNTVALEKHVRQGDREAVPADDVGALVLAARGGESGAFAALYQRFSRAVHAVALAPPHARVEPHEARDVVQEVFLLALERLEQLTDAAAFPGWILGIARTRAAEAARRRRPVELVDEHALPEVPSAEASRALEAIRALPDAYCETLIMRLVEGMTGPEIAERTGLSPGSVRVNLHRGMKLLRERLGIGAAGPEDDHG
jgi:RNA polymerase sigma-70 factor, ECF subfamily